MEDHGALLSVVGNLIRPFKGLIRPFKGLIRPFEGLIRPMSLAISCSTSTTVVKQNAHVGLTAWPSLNNFWYFSLRSTSWLGNSYCIHGGGLSGFHKASDKSSIRTEELVFAGTAGPMDPMVILARVAEICMHDDEIVGLCSE